MLYTYVSSLPYEGYFQKSSQEAVLPSCTHINLIFYIDALFCTNTICTFCRTIAPVSECLYQQTSREGGVKNARHINHISWASLQYSKESNVKILKHPYILCISMEIKGKLGYKRLFLSLTYSCTGKSNLLGTTRHPQGRPGTHRDDNRCVLAASGTDVLKSLHRTFRIRSL